MCNIKIDFVKKDKEKLIKLVEPNFIYNRMDIRFDNEYELLIIQDNGNVKYITLSIQGNTLSQGFTL